MAMNKAGLKSEIIAEMLGLGFVTGSHAKFDLLAEAISNAVIDHITVNAVVNTTSGAPDGEHVGTVT